MGRCQKGGIEMAEVMDARAAGVQANTSNPVYQAYQILHIAFTVAPIVAGLDKFAHLLVDWDKYLAPVVSRTLGGYGHQFMLVVGVIEIIAGIGVALKPKIFAYVVGLW